MSDRLLDVCDVKVTPREKIMLSVAIKAMKDNLANPPSGKQIAAALECSLTKLSGVFTRAMGMGPGRYLANLRYAEAARLLRETDSHIYDICEEVGYSVGTFARGFRKAFGVAPEGYRKLAQAGKPLPPQRLLR